MKQLLNYGVLLVLALTGSCKHPVDVEQVSEPPMPPEGCRIVKTVYKNQSPFIFKFDVVDSEKLTLDDGRQVQVALISTTTYKYDQQNRIVEQVETGTKGDYAVTKHSYNPKQVVESFEAFKNDRSISYVRRDTIQLNEQGLWTNYDKNGQSLYVYNADKQLVSTSPERPWIKYTYQNGNQADQTRFATWIQENGQWVPTDYQYRRYEYNLQRPNLPVVRQYLGADSRNLPTKEIWEMQRSSQFADGPVYQRTYTYFYDKRGLVKRRIANGKPLNPGWLLEDDPRGVGVIDYEYVCP
ncbi:MAG: hypothetical protein LH609_07100 [Rudanella sp.]|nr:hypothetical protein [Rudanella sp.]